MTIPGDISSRLDAELTPGFSAQPAPQGPPSVTASRQRLRQAIQALSAAVTPGEDVVVTDMKMPGSPAVPVRVFAPRQRRSGAVLMWIHGGGFIAGEHEDDGLFAIPLVRELGCTVASVGYRKPPESPYPAATDDCYAALRWLAGPTLPLGFVPDKLAVGGISAGGCLAAATALRARDEKGPALCFQLLLIPVIDNRHATPSMDEVRDPRCWNRNSSLAAWEMYLGKDFLGEVPPYASPARAKDLSGLPPAYVDVAEVDVLRDEAIDYAARLMQAGVRTELHVYPGAYHGSAYFQPYAGISQRSRADTAAALKRAFA